MLDVIERIFVVPLKRSIQSNRYLHHTQAHQISDWQSLWFSGGLRLLAYALLLSAASMHGVDCSNMFNSCCCRAIIASSTLHQLFSEIGMIHDVNKWVSLYAIACDSSFVWRKSYSTLILCREFLEELKVRLRNWTASQCVGEVFVKLSTKLVLYMSYVAHYPKMLLMLDREVEVNPGFRAFLARQENTPATCMKRWAASLKFLSLFLIKPDELPECCK